MTIAADYAIYDTTSHLTLEERRKQRGNSNFQPLKYLNPVELNPVENKLMYINQFKQISENWDGYGASAPSLLTINNAINFLKLLPLYYQKLLNHDEIGITPYGTIVLEWFNDKNNFVSIEVGKSKIGFFSETPDRENPLEQSLEFTPNEIPHQVLLVFNKVFSNL